MKLLTTIVLFTTLTVHARSKGLEASMSSPSLKELQGKVQVIETGKGFKITAEISGLQAGSVHGFHIHENGECTGPDFKSAGGHWNPEGHSHAGPAAEHKHLGDLGNLVANEKGVASTEVFIPKTKKRKIEMFAGKALIIHAKADDHSSQPAGNAGERIACGVLTKKD